MFNLEYNDICVNEIPSSISTAELKENSLCVMSFISRQVWKKKVPRFKIQ